MPITTTALWDTQLFVMSQLEQEPGLMDLIGNRLEDGGGDDSLANDSSQQYPYIVIGEFASRPWDTFRRKGRTIQVTLHIYSNEHGYRETSDILLRVERALHHAPAELRESHHIVSCTLEDDVLQVETRHIRHYVARYRILTQERQ